MVGMRIPPPAFLPKLNSPKWHNKKSDSPIAYLRVQHLSRDRADADLDWILHMLKSPERGWPFDTHPDPVPLSEARELLVRMSRLRRRAGEPDASFERRLDAYWVEALGLIDGYLALKHDLHIAAVREAGASGI